MKRMLTVDEAADLLQLTPGGVRQMVFRRTIPNTKVGRLVRFDPADLEKWIRDRTRGVVSEDAAQG